MGQKYQFHFSSIYIVTKKGFVLQQRQFIWLETSQKLLVLDTSLTSKKLTKLPSLQVC